MFKSSLNGTSEFINFRATNRSVFVALRLKGRIEMNNTHFVSAMSVDTTVSTPFCNDQVRITNLFKKQSAKMFKLRWSKVEQLVPDRFENRISIRVSKI